MPFTITEWLKWGAVYYLGEAEHIIFREGSGLLSIAEEMTTEVGMVYPVDHSLIHLMGNPTDEPFLSLHLFRLEDLGTKGVTDRFIDWLEHFAS